MRKASVMLAILALVLGAVLLVQTQDIFSTADVDMLEGKGTDSPLAAAPIPNYRMPPAIVSAATAPIEGEGEPLSREEFEADLRALQQTQNR